MTDKFVTLGGSATKDVKDFVHGSITDISTAGSHWAIAPVAGKITKIQTVLHGAITVGDAALSFEIGGVAITGGGITVAYDGSAAGDVDEATPTAANTVTAGQAIELITDGGSTDAAKLSVLMTIQPD